MKSERIARSLRVAGILTVHLHSVVRCYGIADAACCLQPHNLREIVSSTMGFCARKARATFWIFQVVAQIFSLLISIATPFTVSVARTTSSRHTDKTGYNERQFHFSVPEQMDELMRTKGWRPQKFNFRYSDLAYPIHTKYYFWW